MKREKLKKEESRKNEEKKQNKEIEHNKKPDSYGKQTKIAVILMIVLLASVFIANWVVQESKKFDYNGMKFYKEKEGSILFYKSLLGFVTASGQDIPFILKLRNDPRELEKISVSGEIRNIKKEAILSLSQEIAECPDTIRTMTDFSITLKAFGIKASAATTNKSYSKEHDIPLIDCKDSKQKTVIVMKEGNETRINQEKDCYTIEIENCEVQQSFERFILDYISNSLRV